MLVSRRSGCYSTLFATLYLSQVFQVMHAAKCATIDHLCGLAAAALDLAFAINTNAEREIAHGAKCRRPSAPFPIVSSSFRFLIRSLAPVRQSSSAPSLDRTLAFRLLYQIAKLAFSRFQRLLTLFVRRQNRFYSFFYCFTHNYLIGMAGGAAYNRRPPCHSC